MANITKTTAANFIPSIWSQSTLRALEANLVMASVVTRQYEGAITAFGDTVKVQKISDMAAGDKAASTDVTFEAITEGQVTITINKHKYAALKLEDVVAAQANVDLRAQYAGKMAYALRKAIDLDLLSEYAGWTNIVGVAGSDIDEATILEAIQKFDDANVPEDNRSLVIKPKDVRAIRQIPRFTEADKLGGGTAPLVTGQIGEIHGVRTLKTTQVPVVSGATKCQMFHTEGLALCMQKDVRVQADYNIRSLAWEVVADVLYGYGELRDEGGVLVNT